MSVAGTEEAIRPSFPGHSADHVPDSTATEALSPTMECQTVTCVVGNFGGMVGFTLAGAQSAARVQVGILMLYGTLGIL